MKRGLSFILSFIMVMGILTSFPLTVNAADTTVLTFKFHTETGGYAVTDCDNAVNGEIVIPDTYNDKPVTTIGTDAFVNCTGLTGVTIPDTVTSIHSYAFYNCTSLSMVNFSNSLTDIGRYAFYNCSYLQELYLPDSLQYIGSYAFAGISVRNLVIPDNVTEIADYAFHSSNAVNIVLGDSVEKIGENAFSYNRNLSSIVIPESLKEVGNNAFSESKYIEKIYITDMAKWCGIQFGNPYSNPLIYCYNLYSQNNKNCYLYLNGIPVLDLVIPETVDTISKYAFLNYTHLKSVTLHDGVKAIREDAFYGTDSMGDVFVSGADVWLNIDFESATSNPLSCGDNPKLYFNGELVTSVNIPERVTEIKSYTFYDCTTLETIEVHENINKIGASAFYNTGFYNNTENWENNILYIGDYLVAVNYNISGDCEIKEGTKAIAAQAFSGKSGVTAVKIPDSVTEIAYRTFYICSGLTSVDFGKGVKIIGDEAFYDCTNLTSFTINDDIERIGVRAFYGCSLSDFPLCLGDNIAYIGDEAFSNCVGISSVRIKGNDAEIGENAFNGCTGITTVVLDGIKTVGERAFSGCTGIESVQLINIKTFSEYAFSGCSSLINLDLGTQLKQIPHGAFYGNTLLENVDFPETLEYIGTDAFRDCKSLSELNIGRNISYIGDYAFYDCEGITSIEIYSTILDTDVTTFLSCSNVKKLHLDTQVAVNKINVSIFDNLEDLTLGEAVTEIPANSFSYGDFITVTIPKSVTKIGDDAFNECPNLSIVYYGGSPSNWNAIYIGANNDYLLNAEIIFAEHDHESCEEWIVDIEATCTQVGSQHKDCVICGIVTETEEIPLKEHIAGDWIVDEQATVYKAGSKHIECTKCGAILKRAEITQLKCSKPTLKAVENSQYGVKITWSKVKGGDSYRVYRKTSKGDWEYLDSTKNGYFTDKTAKSGTKYYYAVKARNESGNTSLSSSLSKYYLSDPTLKTPTSTKSGISLKWTKTTGAQGYIIYRKTDMGSYEKFKTEKGVSNLSYVDKSAKKGVKYTYKVKAYYSKTYSAYSNTKTITDKY